ncbi:MAG: SPOR domain-containing protein [Candidatus Omnitrophota bacterium]|nr:MAG: SPOR domain-containing protein [Candidatus Omnitrophota bacterium]
MPAEYQKELFEEFKKEKGKLRKIADKITRRQPKLYIHISLENIVFAAIIGIMCIIVAFALGVEHGEKQLLFEVRPRTILSEVEPVKAEEALVLEKESAVSEKEALIHDTDASGEKNAFAIQLISYTQSGPAEKEKKRLLDKKIYAFIIPSGKWYQVCAGGYSDINEARKALEEFKEDYKGCFIRKGAK